MTEKDEIEDANQKNLGDFITDYMPDTTWGTWNSPKSQDVYRLTLQDAASLSKSDMDACFSLIEFTSSKDYKASSMGWKPRSKRKEMQLLDLKYILVRQANRVEAFASFMPTYEDDYPVIYCYEIHLAPSLQGTGLGSLLMKIIQSVGERIPGTVKVMLTCFVNNERGVRFYRKLGFETDEFSPPPRKLRNGTVVESDYVILSKIIQR